ncbi:hypothetical protein QQF64_029496 [Cirrhinus molitorella]|uniref:RING-type E3 ubiquitin transferase n=1 Tax=Cirrhinus molitorella TaxID=172907 RepID=A0ABR3N0M1_9TELE
MTNLHRNEITKANREFQRFIMRHLVFLLSLSSVCFFTLSEVVDNNFSKCKEFFLNNAPPDLTLPGVSVKPICQCVRGDKRQQIYLYATLYSTTWKIPVYSAYVYRGNQSIGRCDAWYIEPQLDSDPELCMRSQGYGSNIGTNQALNRDYDNSDYDKGHLYPVLHTNNHLSMLATSTLTNAAPQNSSFNRNAWLRHEEAVITDLKSCEDVAYVVTGVVPDKKASKLKNRVTVSKYYWRATCCLKNNQYIGKGYYGPDEKGKVQELTANREFQRFIMRHLVFLLSLSSVCFFTLSEVVDNNFSKCKEFFLNNAPPDLTLPGVSVKPICQCLWDDNDQQHYLYATLYSTTWKIPVYSAYIFASPNIGRCDAWYIEPQLDGEDEPCMRPKGRNKKIGTNQALSNDYKDSNKYDKGHLYPVLHTNNHLSMLATSTLTNAAPQNSDFNRNKWLRHEEAVITDLKSCEDVAYVVTGVVPDTDAPKLKNRVTVSKYYWRATCCLKNNQYIGKGYYGPDEKGELFRAPSDLPDDTTKMATAVDITRHLQCPICKNLLTDPVSTTCGHTFCRCCLDKHISMTEPQCPLCQEPVSTKPSVNEAIEALLKEFHMIQLPNMNLYCGEKAAIPCDVCDEHLTYKAVKSCLICLLSFCDEHLKSHQSMARFKGHKLVNPLEKLDQRACNKHGRPLELYCRRNERCICALCVKTGEDVIPVETERERRQGVQQNAIEVMERMIVQRENKLEELKESAAKYQALLEKEQQEIKEVFAAMMEAVRKTEQVLLAPLEDGKMCLEKEMDEKTQQIQKDILKYKETIESLNSTKNEEDDIFFIQSYPAVPAELTDDWTLNIDTELNFGIMRNTKANLLDEIETHLEKLCAVEIRRIPSFAVNVTLDAETAHPHLEVSADGKAVCDTGASHDIPGGPQQFDLVGGILGKPRITSGRAFWVVEVGNKEGQIPTSKKAFTVLWTDETKINLYQSDGKRRVWRRKGTHQ